MFTIPPILLQFGPKIVVVIDKKDKSSIIFANDRIDKIPSVVKTSKDPTGASDGYVSGFLAGLLKGFDKKTCGMIGAIEASFVSECLGAQTNLPNWDELNHLLNDLG